MRPITVKKAARRHASKVFKLLKEFNASLQQTTNLEELKNKYNWFSINSGICRVILDANNHVANTDLVEYQIKDKAYERLGQQFRKCFETYSGYSGSGTFPVPHKDGSMDKFDNSSPRQKWVRGGYAKRRRALLQHFIDTRSHKLLID